MNRGTSRGPCSAPRYSCHEINGLRLISGLLYTRSPERSMRRDWMPPSPSRLPPNHLLPLFSSSLPLIAHRLSRITFESCYTRSIIRRSSRLTPSSPNATWPRFIFTERNLASLHIHRTQPGGEKHNCGQQTNVAVPPATDYIIFIIFRYFIFSFEMECIFRVSWNSLKWFGIWKVY